MFNNAFGIKLLQKFIKTAKTSSFQVVSNFHILNNIKNKQMVVHF